MHPRARKHPPGCWILSSAKRRLRPPVTLIATGIFDFLWSAVCNVLSYSQKDYGNLQMPTVLRIGPYRIYFYSHEPNEPPHVHVDRERCSAKFWLSPVQMARNIGFVAHELRSVERLVLEHQQELLEAWDGYFGAER